MTTTPKDDLPEARILPCPFCGGDVRGIIEHDFDENKVHFGVACNGCMVEIDGYETQEEALKAWNTRTPAIADGAPDPVVTDGNPDEIALVYYDGWHVGAVEDFPDAPRYVPKRAIADGVGVEALAHELWAMAQLTPGEGISDAVERITVRLSTPPQAATDEG